ncbi:DNA repair protein RAD51 homolog 3-like isoform X1 [Schistocerca cancellata]|uniref:DNA repair protein RAD51 homolog 3-like isoform X1 n=2 Tax=Schistocerca cancellata TaxID=274614 RepID=UPI0021178CFD|nr:DNA repair protein RAD51 homolog 3-like isoform X1 [Schistocerca cancellata]
MTTPSLIPLVALPIPGDILSYLQSAGYLYYEDIEQEEGSPADNIVKKFASNTKLFWKAVMSPPEVKTALDIWQEESQLFGIVTFCKAIDDMLDGGIPLQSITEFCGAPGSGKTQLCLQLCVDVQIPSIFGGHEAEAVYIDTSSSFTLIRLSDMADACISHCSLIARQQGKLPASTFTMEAIKNGISYISVTNHIQLLAAVFQLSDILEKRNVKLIVIDSITFPLLYGELSSIQRTRLLHQILDELHLCAKKFKVAVVVTNQLTTKVFGDGTSQVVPSLGESFSHRINHRIMLGAERGGTFAAVLLKSAVYPCASVGFQISNIGVRDIGNG